MRSRRESVLKAFGVVNGYIESNSHQPVMNSYQYGMPPITQPGLAAILTPQSLPLRPPPIEISQYAMNYDITEDACIVCVSNRMKVVVVERCDCRACECSQS